MIELYATRIDKPINNKQYEYFWPYISESKREKIKKFYFIDDVNRSLYGDIIVRWLIIKKLNLRNKDIVFEYNEFGKPFLKIMLIFTLIFHTPGNGWYVQ